MEEPSVTESAVGLENNPIPSSEGQQPWLTSGDEFESQSSLFPERTHVKTRDHT